MDGIGLLSRRSRSRLASCLRLAVHWYKVWPPPVRKLARRVAAAAGPLLTKERWWRIASEIEREIGRGSTNTLISSAGA